jgi:hypothetical protein
VRFSAFLQGLGKLSISGVDDLVVDLSKSPAGGAGTPLTQTEVEFARRSILRSKGFVWMAVSKSAAYFMSHAGQYLELAVLGRWWADIKKEDWPAGAKEDEVTADYDGAHGDRRQELVFIGQFGKNSGATRIAIEAVLDSCLLTPEEMKGYEEHSVHGDPALRDYFFP